MANRSIKFEEFDPSIQVVLQQALSTILSKVEHEPVMFFTYNNRIEPTIAETQHATEVLRTVLSDKIIWYGADFYVASALNYLVKDITAEVNKLFDSMSVEEALGQYGTKYDIDMDMEILIELKALAKNICPMADIKRELLVGDSLDKTIQTCAKAMRAAITDSDNNIVDYGQNDIGLVINSTLYRFKSNHEVVWQLNKLLSCYE